MLSGLLGLTGLLAQTMATPAVAQAVDPAIPETSAADAQDALPKFFHEARHPGMQWFAARPALPPVGFDGAFNAAPVYHFRAKLPGPPINAASHAEWSDPVVVGEYLLVGSAAAQALYALSRRDGSVQRVYEADESVEARPTVVGDRVYFSDTGGNTHCYTLDGERMWRHNGNAPILVSPTVTPDGRWIIVTNVDDLAVALRTSDGELEWQYRAKRDLTRETELSLYAAPRAVVHEDQAILGFSNGTLVAVELETGEEVWSRSVGEGRYPDIVADPVVSGTDLYTSGYFRPLVAIDLPSRNIRWRLDVGSANPIAIGDQDGVSVIYHPGTDGKLRGVSALTGAELWVWDSGTKGALTTPVDTEAGLLVASSEGVVYLVDPTDGAEVWRWKESWQLQGVSSTPVIAGRQLLFVSNAGMLYSMMVPRPQAERERRGFRIGGRQRP